MSTLASMPTQPAGPIRIPWPLYRMTLEQYESLIGSGFFAKHDDVQLINGPSAMPSSRPSGRSCSPAGIPASRTG
jgi:hypothetical protein